MFETKNIQKTTKETNNHFIPQKSPFVTNPKGSFRSSPSHSRPHKTHGKYTPSPWRDRLRQPPPQLPSPFQGPPGGVPAGGPPPGPPGGFQARVWNGDGWLWGGLFSKGVPWWKDVYIMVNGMSIWFKLIYIICNMSIYIYICIHRYIIERMMVFRWFRKFQLLKHMAWFRDLPTDSGVEVGTGVTW